MGWGEASQRGHQLAPAVREYRKLEAAVASRTDDACFVGSAQRDGGAHKRLARGIAHLAGEKCT